MGNCYSVELIAEDHIHKDITCNIGGTTKDVPSWIGQFIKKQQQKNNKKKKKKQKKKTLISHFFQKSPTTMNAWETTKPKRRVMTLSENQPMKI